MQFECGIRPLGDFPCRWTWIIQPPGDTDIDIFYRPCRYNIGNAAGEGVRYEAIIQNVNSTTQPYCIHGHYNQGLTGGTHVGGIFYGSAQPAYRDRTLRGIQFIFNSGNIASGYIKLYGIK